MCLFFRFVFSLLTPLYFFLSHLSLHSAAELRMPPEETHSSRAANPFALSFPTKENMTHADYEELQKELRAINIDPLLHELYPKDQGYAIFGDFHRRCIRGIKGTLIDSEKGWFPVKELVKIGKGSDRCIVVYSSYDSKYPGFVASFPKALEDCGFNGYLYYRIGGFPNPTGKEIQYAATPYCFKIFLMLEAQQLGFTNVLWLDSSLVALKDPTPLFDIIEQNGCLLCSYQDIPFDQARIFPKTKELLQEITGIDVADNKHFATGVFGLKMDRAKTKDFVTAYYRFVSMGTPFLSCFPEEFVFASIFLQQEKEWPTIPYFMIMKYGKQNDEESVLAAKKTGVYFYLRPR